MRDFGAIEAGVGGGHALTAGPSLTGVRLARLAGPASGVAGRLRAAGAVPMLVADRRSNLSLGFPGEDVLAVAAAVASGAAGLAEGPDRLGGLAIAAHEHGLAALKPSRGRTAFAASVGRAATHGALGRTIAHLERFLAAAEPAAVCDAGPGGRPLRIALVTELPNVPRFGAGTTAAATAAARALAAAGHTVDLLRLPIDLDEALEPLQALWSADLRAALAAEAPPRVPRPVDALEGFARALAASAADFTAGDRVFALNHLGEVATALEAAAAEVDVILSPVAADPCRDSDEVRLAPDDLRGSLWRLISRYPFGVPYNMAGWPTVSLSFPAARGATVGVQLAARPGAEAQLLNLAAMLEAERSAAPPQLVRSIPLRAVG